MLKRFGGIVVFVVAFVLASDAAVAFSGSGSGTVGDPYQITSCTELQEINDELDAHYILNNSIDCSDTTTWNEDPGNLGTYFGFEPIGTSASKFTGTFDGQGFVISSLYINRTDSSDRAGLFGHTGTTAEIRNVGLTSVDITGYRTGALVSENQGGVDNSYATGTVTSTDIAGGAGGLVYSNDVATASISNSHAGVTVTVADDSGGGLIADNSGTVTNSYATGNVNGIDELGGLAGYNLNIITDSYATGTVTGSNGANVGGLVGMNFETVTNSYATGDVSQTAGSIATGGLVGTNWDGTINRSYATGTVSGDDFVGGLVGDNEGFGVGIINDSYATGSASGVIRVGGLVGWNGEGEVNRSYSIGSVSGTSEFGGLVGGIHANGSVTDSFWDTQTSGQATSAAGEGKTTAEMKNKATYIDAGWDFDAIWAPQCEDYPLLRWQDGVVIEEQCDSDGISDDVEKAGPNNGDANNDGTPDHLQTFVASFVNSATGEYVVLEVDTACEINVINMSTETGNTVADPGFDYPVGLVNFTLDCGTPGYTTTVSQYFYGADSDYVLRKHNPNTNAYFTINDAMLEQTTIDGQILTQVSYQVTDGEDLDIDGTANGIIIDPVGLAQNAVGVPNTGFGGAAAMELPTTIRFVETLLPAVLPQRDLII